MALTTYAEIQDAVRRGLQRDDLDGHIPDFILSGEARLNSQLIVNGGVREMEATATVTLTSGSGSLPTDYLAYRRVYANSSPVTALEAIDSDYAILKYPDTAAEDPKYFYISGSSIYTKPVCSSTLALLYYQKIPALASNTTGNWVTSRDPRLYIYSACLEAAPFIDDDARLLTWGKMLEIAINELTGADNMARRAKSVGRIRGATP